MINGIVSVGYEGRQIDDFVAGLQRAGVRTVADVRLNAISRKPGFSKTRLRDALAAVGIGYVHMRSLERFIERGICAAGGVPFFFGIPGVCDGIAMGHAGMRYSLPLRELIADSVECVARAHALDGLVLLTNCDKITPGMLMALMRLDLPGIAVTAGPMLAGEWRGRRLSLVNDTFEAIGRFKAGEIDEGELRELEMRACPGPGSCQGMYTANTMACLTEAMGLSLPGCATAPAVAAEKLRIAQESGERAVALVREGLAARAVAGAAAFSNAVRADMALGGSTNTVLHLPAIAHEAGVDLPLGIFDRLSRSTPHIAEMLPSGRWCLEDLHRAGGIPAVLSVLGGMIVESPTVGGRGIREIARSGVVRDSEVIRPLEKAHSPEGGIAILRGNIAPDGAVVKQSAVKPALRRFEGRAAVFDGEEQAMKAVMAGRIGPGTVIVVRYEGPKGGPGMREMLSLTAAIVGLGLADDGAAQRDAVHAGLQLDEVVPDVHRRRQEADVLREFLAHALDARQQVAAGRCSRLVDQRDQLGQVSTPNGLVALDGVEHVNR